jgi:DNA-binding winged helix-turn-helix (wHTH) protein/tetratricopeptide (TPR) repeat protein
VGNDLYEFGPFRVDPGKRRLVRDGTPVVLSPKAFDMLLVLINRRGQRLARTELLREVWPETVAGEQNLNQCVAVLRRALGDDPKIPDYIATLPGYGYSFIADVQVIGNGKVLSPPGSAAKSNRADGQAEQLSESTSAPADAEIGKSPKKLIQRLTVTTAILAALASGVYLYLIRHRHNEAHWEQLPAASTVVMRRSVAVLGFDNLSQRPSDGWLSTAISEMLSTEIGAGGKLRIIPRESIARARSDMNIASLDGLSNATLRKVQIELGADLIISGSYTLLRPSRNRNEEIRIDVRVQDVDSGKLIAVGETTDKVAHLFSLVRHAGSQLRQELGIDPISSSDSLQAMAAMPKSLEAAKLYAEGLSKLHDFDTLGARDSLERAVTIKPSFPLTLLYLSEAYASLGEQEKAIESAKKANELSNHLSRELQLQIQAQYAQSLSNYVKAGQVYQALWTFFPDNLDYGLGVANMEIALGKEKDALHTLNRLRDLPAPVSGDPRIDLAEASLRGHLSDFRQGLVPAQRAAVKAKARGERWLYARALEVQAGLLASLSDYQQAMPLDEQARQICESLGDLDCVSNVYRRIGYMKVDSDPIGAETALRKGLRIARQIGDSNQEGADLNGLAALFTSEGRLAEASQIYREGLQASRSRHDSFGIQMYLDNLGEDAIQQGNLKEAEQLEEEGLAVSRQSAQKVGIAYESMDLGKISELEGDLAKAAKHYQLAKSEFREIGIRSGIAWADSGLASVSRERGDFAISERQFDEALSLFRAGTDDGQIAEANLGLAELRIDESRGSDAVSFANRALNTFTRQKRSSDAARAMAVLAEGLLSEGHLKSAGIEARHAEDMLALSEDRLARLFVATSAESLIAELDERDDVRRLTTDVRRLAQVEAEARLRGLTPLALEAEIKINEIDVRSGSRAALTHLKQLESEAQSHGLASIARRASVATAEVASEEAPVKFKPRGGER